VNDSKLENSDFKLELSNSKLDTRPKVELSTATAISILIYIFPASALHPTFISVLSATFALSYSKDVIAWAIVGSRLDYVD